MRDPRGGPLAADLLFKMAAVKGTGGRLERRLEDDWRTTGVQSGRAWVAGWRGSAGVGLRARRRDGGTSSSSSSSLSSPRRRLCGDVTNCRWAAR